MSGYLLAILTMVFFCVGPNVVHFVPRCMAGCILMHMGVGLIVEALYDSLDSFDRYEYGSVLLITLVMTFYGMTPALAVGALCAATTFTLQVGNHVTPIRREMRGRSLRSSLWRPEEAAQVTYGLYITYGCILL